MSRLIFDASTLGGTTTLSSEDAVGNFTIDVPAVTGTMLIPATVGLANQVLTSNATTAPTWAYLAGTGTVTSISGSGGTTGLTLTGGPITTSGTLTLGGTLIAVNGGTGQSSYVVGDVLYASTTTALSKLAIGTTGQVLTVASGIPSWATPTTGTVTSVSFTGGVVSVATATTTPALTVAGTSGGVPYFSSATTWATSAALAASALVIGGGAGVAPSTTTTGTGVVTALGVNVGSAGALITFNGALGTPSSGTVTNLTGTASININGTVGATTATTGAFTTLSTTGNVGIGTASPGAKLAVVGTGYSPAITLTDGATLNWDTSLGQVAQVTLGGNRTFAAPTNLVNGGFYSLLIIQDGTGSRTISWNAVFDFTGGTAPTLSTAAGSKDLIAWRSDGTNLLEVGRSLGVA